MVIKLKRSFFIMLIFMTSAFFISSILFSLEEEINIENEEDFFTKDSVNLRVDTEEEVKNGLDLLNLDEDYLIMKEDVGTANGYGVYFSGDIQKQPNVIKGRYFEKEDFNNGKKVAVIGKGMEQNIATIDGIDYYCIENDNYEVIGVIGDEYRDSPYKYNVYIILDSLITKDSYYLNGNYIIDAGNKTENVYEKLKEKCTNDNIQITKRDKEKIESTSKSYLDEYLKNKVIFALEIVGSFILSTICVTEYWIKKRKKEIGIKRAFGETKLRTFVSIITELLILCLISFGIGYILYLLVTFVREGYVHFYAKAMMLSFIVTIISALITAIAPIISVNKMEPSEVMR